MNCKQKCNKATVTVSHTLINGKETVYEIHDHTVDTGELNKQVQELRENNAGATPVKPYILRLGGKADNIHVLDGSVSEAYAAWEAGETVYVYIPDYGYVIPANIDPFEVNVCSVRVSSYEDGGRPVEPYAQIKWILINKNHNVTLVEKKLVTE